MRYSTLFLTALTSLAYATAVVDSEDLALPKPRPECPPCCKVGCDLAICNKCDNKLPPAGQMTIMNERRAVPCETCTQEMPPPGMMTIMKEKRAIPTPVIPEPRVQCPACCKKGCKLAICNKCEHPAPQELPEEGTMTIMNKPRAIPECPECCARGCKLATCGTCVQRDPPPGMMTIMERAIPTPPPNSAEEEASTPVEKCPSCCPRCKIATCNEPICKNKANTLEAREPEKHIAPPTSSECPSCCPKNGRPGCALAACATCKNPPIEARAEDSAEVLPMCPSCCATAKKPVGCKLAACNNCAPHPEPRIPIATPAA